jgi:hypothetical protein
MCETCYYQRPDKAMLPIPFRDLFGEKAKFWDDFI